MTDPPQIDWSRAPHLGAVMGIALALSIAGGVGLFIGLAVSVLYGTALTIAGAVLLGSAGVCWSLYGLALWWRQESRNQMLTVVAALVRNDAEV